MVGIHWAIRILPVAALAASVACTATESAQNNPTAPSAVASSQAGGVETPEGSDVSNAGPTDSGAPGHDSGPSGIALPPEHLGPSDVTFPPRNEPLLFRTALETKYRDELRRSTVQTFVDQEGTVVWTQEYLRYRVNLCSHADAVFRVFRQIDGFGVQPVCGSTNSVVFPPRNEPYDFMIQLESKYRTGLGRPAILSYVDIEGNIVWTQEYLRYRVSSCSHFDAQQRVFDQIDGRGVRPDCSSGGGGGSNTLSGSIGPLGDLYFIVTMQGTGRYQATLRWADASIDLDLYLATTSCTTYPPTSCILTQSDRVGVNSETVTWNVRAGERYHLWVDNFTDRSTTFTVEHFITAAGGPVQPTAEPVKPARRVQVGGRKAKS